jgi:PBSX family phage terminase large subunit
MKLIGYSPTKKQSEIINGVLNTEAKYHVVSLGRQSGKSLMAMNLVLYWAINHRPCKILWISPVYSQANKVQHELDEAIRNSNIIETCNYSDNYIKLKTGSEIYFRSAERYDNIRGYTFDYCIVDEAAYIKEEAWLSAIKPTLAVRGKKILFLSTPKGKNWFYNLYQLSNGNSNYKAYNGPTSTNPLVKQSEIDEARQTLPPNIFRTEYLAEFVDDGGEVFQNLSNNTFNQWPKANGTVYCGIDLGKQNDYTVATFIDKTGNIVEIYRNNQTEWSTLINDLSALINKYNAAAYVEVNSIGDVVYEQLKSKVKQIEPFVTSNKSKAEIIEGLILDLNEGNIKIPSKELFPALYNELSVFTYEYNPKSRSVRYGAPNGHHDDCVMSLALANLSLKKLRTLGNYSYIY